MEEILHQLVGNLPHDLQCFYIPDGAGFLPSTVLNNWPNGHFSGLKFDIDI